ALLRPALDEMAADESLNLRQALRRSLSHIPTNSAARRRIAELAMRQMKYEQWPIRPNELPLDMPAQLASLIRHPVMIRTLAAEGIVEEVSRLDKPAQFVSEIPRSIVEEIAAMAPERPKAIVALENLFLHPERKADSTAATLLLAIDPNWRPPTGR